MEKYQQKQSLLCKRQTEDFIEKMESLTKSAQGWEKIQKSGLDKLDPSQLTMQTLMEKLENIQF